MDDMGLGTTFSPFLLLSVTNIINLQQLLIQSHTAAATFIQLAKVKSNFVSYI